MRLQSRFSDACRLSSGVTWAVLALGVASGIYVWFATHLHGLGTTRDGMVFVSAARSLIAGEGFAHPDGTPMTLWPPGYSFMLALGGWITDPYAAGRGLHAITMVLLVLCVDAWLRSSNCSGHTRLGAAAVMTTSIPLTWLAAQVRSELVFILWTTVGLAFLSAYVRAPSRRTAQATGGAFLAAVLTRYMGIAAVVAALVLIVGFSSTSWRRRLEDAAWATVPSVIGGGAWLVRNQWVSGTTTGGRIPSPDRLLENIDRLVQVIALWVLPDEVAAGIRDGIGILLLAGLIGGAIAVYGVAVYRSPQYVRRRLGIHGIVSITYAALYAGALLAATTLYASDRLNGRLASPLFVPGWVAAFALGRALLNTVKHTHRRWLRTTLIAVGCLWLLFPTALSGVRLHNMYTEGSGGFATNRFVNTATLQRAVANPDGCAHWVSNAPSLLYFQTGRVVQQSPRAVHQRTSVPASDLKPFHADLRAADEPICLVWFDAVSRPFLLSPDALQAHVTLRVLSRHSDGTLYIVEHEKGL